MNSTDKTIYCFIGMTLFLFGFGLLWAYAGFWTATGIILLIWGNNMFLKYRRIRRLSLRNFGLSREPTFGEREGRG